MVHMVQLARPNRPNVEWKMNENDGRSTELGVREKKDDLYIVELWKRRREQWAQMAIPPESVSLLLPHLLNTINEHKFRTGHLLS